VAEGRGFVTNLSGSQLYDFRAGIWRHEEGADGTDKDEEQG